MLELAFFHQYCIGFISETLDYINIHDYLFSVVSQ